MPRANGLQDRYVWDVQDVGDFMSQEKKDECARDPVCAMDVLKKDCPFRLWLENQEFFFCTKECLDAFSREPKRFLDGMPGRMTFFR